MIVAVLGTNSIAKDIAKFAKDGIKIISLDSTIVNIHDAKTIASWFVDNKVDWFINTEFVTDDKFIADNFKIARKINIETATVLHFYARLNKTKFMQIVDTPLDNNYMSADDTDLGQLLREINNTARIKNFNLIIAPNVYSEQQNDDSLITKLYQQVLNNVTDFKEYNRYLKITYSKNLVNEIFKIIENNNLDNFISHISDGSIPTIHSIIDCLSEGKEFKLLKTIPLNTQTDVFSTTTLIDYKSSLEEYKSHYSKIRPKIEKIDISPVVGNIYSYLELDEKYYVEF